MIHNHAPQENGGTEVDLYRDFAGPDPREIRTDAGLSQNCRGGRPSGKGVSFLFLLTRKLNPKPSNVATHCFPESEKAKTFRIARFLLQNLLDKTRKSHTKCVCKF